MSNLLVAIPLLIEWVLVVTIATPFALVNNRFVYAHPRFGLTLWFTAFTTSALALLTALGLAVWSIFDTYATLQTVSGAADFWPSIASSFAPWLLLAFGGIMMALLRREQSGRGDFIDISMHDSVLAWTPNITGSVFAQGRSPVPRHERSLGGSAFYNIYRTSDGRHVVLGAQEIKFVRNLLTEIGRTDLVELCERGPGPHQAPLIELLRQWF